MDDPLILKESQLLLRKTNRITGREDTSAILWLAMHLKHIDSVARKRKRYFCTF